MKHQKRSNDRREELSNTLTSLPCLAPGFAFDTSAACSFSTAAFAAFVSFAADFDGSSLGLAVALLSSATCALFFSFAVSTSTVVFLGVAEVVSCFGLEDELGGFAADLAEEVRSSAKRSSAAPAVVLEAAAIVGSRLGGGKVPA